MTKIVGRPPGAPSRPESKSAGEPKSTEAQPAAKSWSAREGSAKPARTSAPPQSARGESAAQPAPGLPIASPMAAPNRASGAVGAAIAYQLAQAWKREPGEKRIPKKSLKTVMAKLPSGPPPNDDGLLEGEAVVAYCNTLQRRPSRDAKQLMAGMSGAQVFEVEDDQGNGSIFKMFCSDEEMLQDVAGLEVIAALKGHPLRSVTVEHAGQVPDGKRGFVVMEKARGTVLYDRIDQLAAAEPGAERARLLALLCEELRCVGAALARFHDAGRASRPVPDAYKRLALSRVRGLWRTACEKATKGGLLDPAVRERVEERLRALAKDFMLPPPVPATVCIGDIHPGNVAVQDGECTVFDVSTLVGSLGSDGQGIAPCADDRVWFAETLRWYGRRVKLSSAETEAASSAFLDAYRNNSSLQTDAGDAAAAALFRARSALMDLRFAPDSENDLERVLVALGETTP